MSVQGSSNHHYISNAELLAWMSAKTGALNDEMADAMDIVDQRAKITKRLTDIKAGLSGIDKDGGKGCEAADQMRQLLEEYKDHPAAEELTKTLQPMIDQLDQAKQAWEREHPPSRNATQSGPSGISMPSYPIVTPASPPGAPRSYDELAPSAQKVTDWQDQIQGKIDGFGKDDQTAMIRIQDISSRANQAMQLASNLIASNNEAAKTAIGNIRG